MSLSASTPSDNPPPILNPASSTPWLLILLTTLDTQALDYLEERLQPIPTEEQEQIETWTPSPSLLKSLAKQSHHIDSQANLYALAIKIHKTGRTRFLVADELSRRQLTKTQHHGEAKEPSIIIISIYEASAPNGVSVWARRDTCKKEKIVQMFERSDSMRQCKPVVVPGVDFIFEPVSEREVWGDPGLELRDPDWGLFARAQNTNVSYSESDVWTGWQEHVHTFRESISSRRLLPTEIIDHIVAQEVTGPRVPMWKHIPSDEHLVIFLFFPTSEAELHRLERLIQSVLNDPHPHLPSLSVELIRWESHRLHSRREIMSFWIEYHRYCILFRKMGYPPLHILLEPINDISTPSFVEIISRNKSVATATRTTLRNIIQVRGDRFRNLHYPAEEKENLSDPDLPFCYTCVPWQTAGLWSRQWIPAFYLTKQLSEEEVKEIKKEIKISFSRDIRTWWKKECGFVLWDQEDDGDIEDIWDIVQRVHAESCFGRGYDVFICLDQQSAVDDTVIMVVPQYWHPSKRWDKVRDIPCPGLVGFTYARVPGRRAHLEGCDIKFNEHDPGYDFKRFRRSDIPVSSDFFDDMDMNEETKDNLWGGLSAGAD